MLQKDNVLDIKSERRVYEDFDLRVQAMTESRLSRCKIERRGGSERKDDKGCEQRESDGGLHFEDGDLSFGRRI